MDIRDHLDTLSALRVEYTALPAQKLAAILRQLDPDTAARVEAIMREFDDREAQLTAEIAALEATIKTATLTAGAGAHGTSLQAILVAPRVTWDTKGMDVYRALHPEVNAYRKVGEPSVQLRAHGARKR